MIKGRRLFFLLVYGIVLVATNTMGNHIAAVEISYKGVDTFNYVVTIKIYRDCRDLNPINPPFVNVLYNSVNCALSGNSNLPIISGDSSGNVGSGNFIQLPCLGIDTCDINLPGYAVEEFVFMDTITLPGICDDWILSYQTLGKRNNNDVITDATDKKIYVSALLNNQDAPGNSSPVFEKPPVAIFCENRDFYFDQGAIEYNGDSLVYSLAAAQGDLGTLLAYEPGYNYQTPFNVTSPPLSIDFINGVLSFTPIAPVVTSVLCVQIEEYNDAGVLVGSIKNDMQVYIDSNCEADTLNFTGDTTTPSGIHPAITVNCLDQVIVLHFDNYVQCGTIAPDGSDFIITMPIGGTLSIDSTGAPGCVGGLTDSIVLYLSDSMRYNGSYYIYDTIGTDGIPILSECGLKLNDTLEVVLNNCVKAEVDLLNVTVENNNNIRVTWSKYTENFSDVFFNKYYVQRSDNPGGPYAIIDSITSIKDTFYLDQNVSVSSQGYNYQIDMDLAPALQLTPLSDSIQSIYLQYSQAPTADTNDLDLAWTSYWGWDNPSYQLMQSIGNEPWVKIHQTGNTSYRYKKSVLANNYRFKIITTDDTYGFVSESNWIGFDVPVKLIPNIITPNGDGLNDKFFINEQLLYEPVHMIIYNRWGEVVFQDEDYRNDWNGDNFFGKPLSEGTYYYVLLFTSGENRAGFLTIIREGK